MSTRSTAPLTEPQLLARLAARYAPPEYAFVPHVADATGGRKTRTCDALAMSLWPSRGLVLHGFEVKSARSDWKRELADPAKAEAIGRYCDHWWVVAGRDDVVEVTELPAAWGLLEPYRDGLRVARPAPKRQHVAALDHAFVASFLRGATEAMVPRSAVADLAEARVKEAQRRAQESNKWEVEAVRREVEHYKSAIEQFERLVGVELSKYNGPRLAEAYRLLKDGGVEGLAARLGQLLHEATSVTTAIRAARDAFAAADDYDPIA